MDSPTKANPALLEEMTQFDKTKLQKTNTEEKVSLPTPEVIQREKTEHEMFERVKSGVSLKHVETVEKDPLKEVVAQEKVQLDIQQFDASCLKRVDTQERNRLPSLTDIEEERKGLKN